MARLGKVGIVQYDSLLCNSSASYAWATAKQNFLWTKRHGYVLAAYCIQSCRHGLFGTLHPAWCKLVAIAHALKSNRFDTLLYLDSDAVWLDTSVPLDVLADEFLYPGDWEQGESHISKRDRTNIDCNGAQSERRVSE
uniref:Nucleotide-diphospho-sugar transferase domain-containing protein n=1 Tax=Chrysotila carterae TaxID=13221 RepID=A0A7S4F1W3_CHRCT